MRLTSPAEYDIPRELSVSFTGHRPQKLPWERNEADERCMDFKRRLGVEIIRAYEQGARYFLSGMADGVDIIAAEEVLRLKESLPDIKLIAVFPYGTGENARIRRAAERAERVVVISEKCVTGCFAARNRFLVSHSFRLIAGFGGDEYSGTGQTIRMALEQGLDIVILNL